MTNVWNNHMQFLLKHKLFTYTFILLSTHNDFNSYVVWSMSLRLDSSKDKGLLFLTHKDLNSYVMWSLFSTHNDLNTDVMWSFGSISLRLDSSKDGLTETTSNF